jgi:DNA-binding response OmpR family regulator
MTRSALVIEDNLDLAEIYRLTLDMLDYESQMVYDGKEALDRLNAIQEQPYLLILDMNLPQVSGHYIYKKLRSDPKWDTMRVIISTANTIVASALAEELHMGDRIIVKPVTPTKLKAVIKELEAEDDTPATEETPQTLAEGDDLDQSEDAEDSVSHD